MDKHISKHGPTYISKTQTKVPKLNLDQAYDHDKGPYPLAQKDHSAILGRSMTGFRGTGSKIASLSMNRGSPQRREKIPGGVDLSELKSIMSGGA